MGERLHLIISKILCVFTHLAEGIWTEVLHSWMCQGMANGTAWSPLLLSLWAGVQVNGSI